MTSVARSGMLPAMLAVCTLAVIGCTEPRSATEHPNLASGPRTPSLLERSASTVVRDLQTRLEGGVVTLRIGSLAGDPNFVLGRPVAAATDASGGVLVLDALSNELRRFSADGSSGEALIRAGRGPGEISHVLSIARLGQAADGSGLVLAIATRVGVKTFRIVRDTVHPMKEWQPPEIPVPSAACLSSTALHVRSGRADEGGVLRRVSTATTGSTMMGRPYWAGSPLVRSELSAGPLACTDEGGVLVGYTYLPHLFAYDRNGKEIWNARVPDFTSLTFEEGVADGGASTLRMRFDRGGDLVLGLYTLGQNAFVLQVATLAASSPARPNVQSITRTRTFIVDAHDGSAAQLQIPIGQIIGADEKHVYSVEEGDAGHPVVVRLSLSGTS